MDIAMKMWKLLFISLFLPAIALAQRLPDTARPVHYEVFLNPDLNSNALTGKEKITLDLKENSSEIYLNSVDLALANIRYSSGTESRTGTAHYEKDREMVRLKFDQQLSAGTGTLEFDFEGQIRTDLRGLYTIKSSGRLYAATQFEGTYARMMFPCFDEPDYKATYDLTVVTDLEDTAISNGKIDSVTAGPGPKKHTIRFNRSPKMSTYLVALAIGEFACVQDQAGNTPIRVCAIPEKKDLGNFALKSAVSFLNFYNKWYGIPYPYEKLDMAAIPDYEWGGMENTASVFYRESALLIDEKTASVSAKRRVAGVVAHELAHQWFGDLVTMKWWDNIWLNEGFATWITFKPLQAWDPNWDQNEEEAMSTAIALGVDSLASTRAIRAKAETPDEIKEMFDGVAYDKAGAVLRMMEVYVGSKVFQSSVNAYVEKHANGNATAEDFFDELSKISGKPAGKVMFSFVDQPGVPLITAKQTCETGKGKLELKQQRFFNNVKNMEEASPELWQIPICMRSLTEKENTSCKLLTDRAASFSLESCDPLILNSGAKGYYRVSYDPETLKKISSDPEAWTSAELIALLNDQWSLVRIGRIDIGSYLDLTQELRNTQNRPVGEILIGRLERIGKTIVTKEDQESYESWFREWLDSMQQNLGPSGLSDSDDRKVLRASVFKALGVLGDPKTVTAAGEILSQFQKNPESVDASMAAAAFVVVASQGNADLYKEFLSQLKTAKTPEIYLRYLMALPLFSDPELTRKSLDFVLTPEMRGQDVPAFMAELLNDSNRGMVWTFVKNNWQVLQTKMVSFGGGPAIESLGEACDREFHDDVKQFFSKHSAPAAERGVLQALESMNNCMEFRSLQELNFRNWMNNQKGSVVSE
jgi:aminopeptidase N